MVTKLYITLQHDVILCDTDNARIRCLGLELIKTLKELETFSKPFKILDVDLIIADIEMKLYTE